jgi:hypothetical protein
MEAFKDLPIAQRLTQAIALNSSAAKRLGLIKTNLALLFERIHNANSYQRERQCMRFVWAASSPEGQSLAAWFISPGFAALPTSGAGIPHRTTLTR